MGVLDFFGRGGQSLVLRGYDIGMQSAARPETGLSAGASSIQGEVGVAHISGRVGHIDAAVAFESQRHGDEFALTPVVEELVEPDEHLDAHVHRHIVAGAGSEGVYARTGGGNFIRVCHAESSLDGRANADCTGADSPDALHLGNQGVQVFDLLCGFGLWEVYLGNAGPDGGSDVNLGIGAVDSYVDFRRALPTVFDGLPDQGAGVLLLGLRNGVFQVEVEIVAVSCPGSAHETRVVDGHGQAGSPDSSSHLCRPPHFVPVCLPDLCSRRRPTTERCWPL